MHSRAKRIPKALPPPVRDALLAAIKAAGSQVKVAEALGCSNAVVSQLSRDAYLGDVATYELRIRGKYMAETVTCPVMGELARNDCLDYQKRPLAFTNPLRVALRRACATCPNRRETT